MTMNSTLLSKTFGLAHPPELEALKSGLQLLPEAPTMVEIGTGAGTTLLAMLEQRPQARVWTIDILPSSATQYVREAGHDVSSVTFWTVDSHHAASWCDP